MSHSYSPYYSTMSVNYCRGGWVFCQIPQYSLALPSPCSFLRSIGKEMQILKSSLKFDSVLILFLQRCKSPERLLNSNEVQLNGF